jgi:hypothetical protein
MQIGRWLVLARVLVPLLALAAPSGCGDDEGAAAAGGTGGSAPTGLGGAAGQGGLAGAPGTSGAGGSVAPNAGAGGLSASGAGGAAGSGLAAEVTPENLFPLAVGNRWTFRVTTPVASGSPCPAGDHSTEIVGRSTVGGRDAFEAKHVCDVGRLDAVRLYAYSDVGVETQRCSGGVASCGSSWSVALPRPIVDGAQLEAPDGERVLRRVGRLSVEAGTFDDCWELRSPGSAPLLQVYCVGVGPVAFSQREDLPMPNIDYALELTSFVVQ